MIALKCIVTTVSLGFLYFFYIQKFSTAFQVLLFPVAIGCTIRWQPEG